MSDQQLEDYQSLPTAESCRRLDFESAELTTLESFPPQYVLTVKGTKPYLNMEVELIPLVHIRQPEFWGIEVVGRLRGIGLPALGTYEVSLSLNGIIGTQGIEVIGATRSEQILVPPEDDTAPGTGGQGLFGHWVHSFEEDTEGVRAYRRRGFPFPPAFGRTGLEIHPSGQFVRHDIGPADEPVAVPGRWQAERIRAVFPGDAQEQLVLSILSYDAEMMRIQDTDSQ
jgi:hypothetical protein